MIKTTDYEYYKYLNTRTKIGSLYRKYFLYPKLSSRLKGKILDLGCGIGDFLKFNKNAFGLDINPFNVKYCLDQGLKADVMDHDKIPLDDCTFDSIILDNVLEHINNPTVLLSEIKRVLRPGGILLIGVPCEKGHSFDKDHKKFYDISTLKDLLKNDYTLISYFYTPPLSYSLRKIFRQVTLYSVFKLK
jgi:SAM-dependent methyltransferase